jgi:hypothetical protein
LMKDPYHPPTMSTTAEWQSSILLPFSIFTGFILVTGRDGDAIAMPGDRQESGLMYGPAFRTS